MPASQDVSQALRRVKGVLNPRKQIEKSTRDIRLGLERISRVTQHTQFWQGVHVGGTNGKGSICAYLSGLFTLGGISYGRFVSPAFPEKHHSVSINGRHVHPRVFEMESKAVQSAYEARLQGWSLATGETPGPLSPFEIETATAFRIFNSQRVQYGIVEVGMGGETDATNVMRRKGVTIISKIDIDHTEYLGDTIEKIAKVKAGIMKPGVPCIVDETNDPRVIKILREHARNIGATIHLTWKADPIIKHSLKEHRDLEPYQIQNLKCAALAFRHMFPQKEIDLDRLLEMDPYLPGRLEWVGVSKMTNDEYKAPVLVDAAHNLVGVQTLATYVHKHLRPGGEAVTWIIGFSQSQSKPFSTMLETIIRPHDNVAFVQYEGDENDPPAVPQEIGHQLLQQLLASEDQIYMGSPNIKDAIQWASTKAQRGHIIVTGSLYLIKDFYRDERLQRYRETKTLRPGSSQLWRLSQLWRHRPLTKEEYREFRRAKFQWHFSWMNDTMKKIQGKAEEKELAAVPDPEDELVEKEGPKLDLDDTRVPSDIDIVQDANAPDAAAESEPTAASNPEDTTVVSEDPSENLEDPILPSEIDVNQNNEAPNPAEERSRLEAARKQQDSWLDREDPDNDRKNDLDNPLLPSELGVAQDAEAPKPTYQSVNSLISKVRFHQKQADAYRAALQSISDDLTRPSNASEASDSLRDHAPILQTQADHHLRAAEALHERIRNHPDAPRQLTLEQSEIFRRPAFRRASRFNAATEFDVKELKKEAPQEWAAMEKEEEEEMARLNAPMQVPLDYWGRPIGIEQTGEEKVDPFAALASGRREQ